MKNVKMQLADLADQLANQTTIERAIAESFLRSLFAQIESALIADGVVKIAGFGTFKTQWNEPRKSVDVNTGAEILIEGYTKVVFAPELSLKERLNEPYAHLESTPLDEESAETPLRKMEVQAEEIKDILSALNNMDTKEEAAQEVDIETEEPYTATESASETPLANLEAQAEEIKDILSALSNMDTKAETVSDMETEVEESYTATESASETPLANLEAQAEEIKAILSTMSSTETKAESVSEEPITLAEPTAPQKLVEPTVETTSTLTEDSHHKTTVHENNITPVPTMKPVTPTPTSPHSTKKSQGNGWKYASFVILALCVIVVALYFIFQDRVTNWMERKGETEVVQVVTDPPVVDEQPTTIFDQPRTYSEFIKTEKLTEGSRLAWLSQKYYGHPKFWVYIYEANQSLIADPNFIIVGTPVKVPKLPAELIDLNNPACLEYAQKLHDQYVKR